MSQTKVGEISLTDKGTLVISVSLQELVSRLSQDPIEALWDGDGEPPKHVDATDTSDKPVEDSGSDKPKSEPQVIDPFEKGVMDKKAQKEIFAWLVANKISYRNFCEFLRSLTFLGPDQLSEPLIGTVMEKDNALPTLKKCSARFYSYWLTKKKEVKDDYFDFLNGQLAGRGLTIQEACEILEGEVIDPSEIPVGTEVSL